MRRYILSGAIARRRQFQPGVRSTPQRTHACDPILFQEERRTGTRSFVRSSAEENDVAVTGNLLVAHGEFA